MDIMGTQEPEKEKSLSEPCPSDIFLNKVKFEVYGEEMLSKVLKQSDNSSRVYFPPEWIGKHIKIIRID